jgi:hypothetical protein
MGRVRRLGALLAAVALLAACTPQELGDLMAPEDLRRDGDPEVSAAGYAAEALEDNRTVAETAEQALQDKDSEELEQAAKDHPADPRYHAYLAALALADRDGPSYYRHLEQGATRYRKTQKTNGETAETRWILVVLGSLDRALSIERARTPLEPERIEMLEWGYCFYQFSYRSRLEPLSRDVLDIIYGGNADCSNWHP